MNEKFTYHNLENFQTNSKSILNQTFYKLRHQFNDDVYSQVQSHYFVAQKGLFNPRRATTFTFTLIHKLNIIIGQLVTTSITPSQHTSI